MTEVIVKNVAARPMAAVKRRVRLETFRKEWEAAEPEVAKFLRGAKGVTPMAWLGFVFQPDPKGDGSIGDGYYGRLVAEPFKGKGNIQCISTPAGEAATALNIGPFEGLSATHAAVRTHISQAGMSAPGAFWEVYNTPSTDPASWEAYVYYLLARR